MTGPDAHRMVADLSALIACDTCFPPGDNYPVMADLLRGLFADLGGTWETVEVPEALWAVEGVRGARVNPILRPDMGSPDLPEALIYFHVDTAPIGSGWTRPALSLTREGEKLFGRGAADMKGTIASVLGALRSLRDDGAALAFRPMLAFCTDEEGGRFPGIRYLAETRGLPEVLLNLNGSAEPRIWAGCFGSLTLRVDIRGKSAHSGTPERGINAIDAALPLLNALARLKIEVEARQSAMPAPPWSGKPLRPCLNVTAIHGGDSGSAIPGVCSVTVNRRYMPEEAEDDVRVELEACVSAALANAPATGWSVTEVGHLPPVSDPGGPATDRWTAARALAFDVPCADFMCYGSTTSSDFGWVQRAGQTHILLGGLARSDRNIHAADEFTTLSDLMALALSVRHFFSADLDPAIRARNVSRERQPVNQ